jgi:hypothetical protein
VPGPPDAALQRRADVLAEEVLGETVLLDPAQGSFARLNRVGALLWEELAGPATPEALADLLVRRFGLGAVEARSDVDAFVSALSARGLIVPA